MSSISTPPSPPAAAPVPRADAVRNRRQLLDAARAAFADEGARAPIRSIVARAGLAKGTFFRHFASKDELVRALLEDRLEELLAIATQINREHAPGWEAFHTLITRLGDAVAADRSVLHGLRPDVQHREALAPAFAALHQAVAECLERAQAVGEVRADVVASDVQVLMIAITGATAPVHRTHPHLGERYRTILLDGLRTTTPTSLPGPPISAEALGDARRQMNGPGC